MQATKFKVTVEVEVLSLDVAPALIAEAIDNMHKETRTGSLMKEDGDCVKWSTKTERVDF